MESIDIDANERAFLGLVKVGESNQCWPWKNTPHTGGYGKFTIRRTRRAIAAHRASWMLFKGPIPSGVKVLHKCDNPICVNPGHLFLGSQMDNIQDCIQKGRFKSSPGESSGKNILTGDQVYEIRKSFDPDTVSIIGLAKLYGVSAGCMSHVVHGRSWPNIPWPERFPNPTKSKRERQSFFAPKGESHQRSKLTDWAVRRIRIDVADGSDLQVLADRYNVGRDCIRKAAFGITWKHVD